MFEKEIKFIADYNLNMVKSFGSFITFEKLLGSSMHPAVIQYVSAELDYLVSEDRRRLLQDSVFDYSGPETARYFNLIAQEVKRNKKISFEDLKKLVIQAVSFNLNYLARPKWSLSKLIYNDDETKPIDEVRLNLNYIYYYDYIKSIFLSYISKRKLSSLSVTDFELILNKLDYELFGTQPKKLVDYSLYSMAEFFNLGEVNKSRIPIPALELFLKEKNQMDYLFRLKKSVPENSNQKLEIEDVKKIIYSAVQTDIAQASGMKPEAPAREEELTFREHESFQPEKSDFLNEQENISGILLGGEEEEISEAITPEETMNDEPEPTDYNFQADEILSGESDDNTVAGNVEINEIDLNTEFNITDEPSSPAEDAVPADNTAINEPTPETVSNEDFFSMFSEEIKKMEEKDEDLKQNETPAGHDELKKENDEKYYNFEEETENLLKAFKDTVDDLNSKDINYLEDPGPKDLSASNDMLKDFHDEINSRTSAGTEFNFEAEIPKIEKPGNEIPRIKRDRDILDSMSHNEIDKIISNVFNDDRKDFADTMERLNECSTYDEATEILKSVFVTYRVNPYTKDALTLTNTVANYFTRE